MENDQLYYLLTKQQQIINTELKPAISALKTELNEARAETARLRERLTVLEAQSASNGAAKKVQRGKTGV